MVGTSLLHRRQPAYNRGKVTWLRELGQALRRLRREPGFTSIAVLTLAVGLGAATTMFGLVEGVLLRPLPFRDPGQLVAIREVIPTLTRQYPSLPVNYLSFDAWRRNAHSFSGFTLVHPAAMDLTSGPEPQQVVGDQVSAGFFELLGRGPAIGRGFVAGEDAPGRNRVLVLTQGLAQQQFGSARAALGRTLTLDGVNCEVVGVLPAGFHFLRGADWGTFTAAAAAAGEPQFYQPAPFTAKGEEVAGRFDFGVIGRLRPGATLTDAKAELDRLTAGLLATDPTAGIRVVTALTPLRDQSAGAMRDRLWLLLGAVLVVLLLVALNLAILMLARTQARAPEAALRQALGASRGQVARGWLVEAGLLATAGGGLGILLTIFGLRIVVATATVLPRAQAVRLDVTTVLFAAAAALVAALVCATPVVRLLAHGDAAGGLALAGPRLAGAGGGARARSWLVAGESALTAALLILTGLLLHSFVRLSQLAPGYDAGPKLIVAADLAGPPGPRVALWRALPSRLEALPGVARAALSTELPLQGTGVTSPVLVPGDNRPPAQQPIANYQYVSPGYFAALGIAVRGREFTARDLRPDAPPVAVVSAATAARVWPGRDALGQLFRAAAADPPTIVVGVANDVRTDLRQAPGPMVFEPSTQDLRRHLAWIIVRPRAGAELGLLAAEVRAAIHRLQPAAVITHSESMQDLRAAVVAPQRLQLSLAAGFGVLALLIAGLGVYGVVSYTVESRRGELGVRLALGAGRANIAAWTVRRALAPVLAGLVAGVAAALLLARELATQVYGVGVRDPWAFGLGPLLLLLVSLLACALPARRAARTDPLVSLRR